MNFNNVRILLNTGKSYKKISGDKTILPNDGKKGYYDHVFLLERGGEKRIILLGPIFRTDEGNGGKGYDAGVILTVYKFAKTLELIKSYHYEDTYMQTGYLDETKMFDRHFLCMELIRYDKQGMLFNCYDRVLKMDFDGNLERIDANLDPYKEYAVIYFDNEKLKAPVLYEDKYDTKDPITVELSSETLYLNDEIMLTKNAAGEKFIQIVNNKTADLIDTKYYVEPDVTGYHLKTELFPFDK